MSGESSPEPKPQLDYFSRFQALSAFARRHFHQGRGGRAKLAISASLISRIITTVVSFVILPITVRYLGNEGYGLMVTITSVVGWLQFTNLGIGLGLQNALTYETAGGNVRAQRELISTAVFSLAAVGGFILVAGLIVFPHVNWTAVFPPTTQRFTSEIGWTVLVVFIGFVSNIVLGFVNPMYAARQELHVFTIQVILASVLSLAGTLVAVSLRLGLLGLTVCTIGITTVIQWSFAIWTLYFRGVASLKPSASQVTSAAAAQIYRTGISFFILQICNIAFFQIDAFLIARFLTIDQVTPYSVAQKVFIQASGLFAIVTGSLWAAYGNAKAQSDFAWIRQVHRRILRAFLLFFGLLTAGMIMFGHIALTLWVGRGAAPTTLLLAAVGLYFCVRDWTGVHATLLNGLNVVRPQVWNVVLTAVLTLGFDLVLIRRLGPLGLAVGGLLAFSLTSAWYFPYLARKELAVEVGKNPPHSL